MTRQITYKKQGNGQDSWIIRYPENPEMLPEIVFEDPTLKNKADETVLSLLENMTPEGIERIKTILK